MATLFDEKYYYAAEERTTPISIEEFVEFGLAPEDYVRYVGLVQGFQSELLLTGFPKSKTLFNKENSEKIYYPTIEALIEFCEKKKFISAGETLEYYLKLFDRSDVEYYYGWLRYPKESDEFRLILERKLSAEYGRKEEGYKFDKFGEALFVYKENEEGKAVLNLTRRNSDTGEYETIKRSEVRKMFESVLKDRENIEKEIEEHLNNQPIGKNVSTLMYGKKWIKKYYDLLYKQEIIESVADEIESELDEPETYEFKENDVLYVFIDENTCDEENHILSDVKVRFQFYGKPSKEYTIERCANCCRFQISLEKLNYIFESYGVIKCNIKYDHENYNEFSGFAETSIFRDLGYTVGQSIGLSTKKRQNILKFAIDSGKASKYEVMNFLKQRIMINGSKEGNELAVKKWEEDYKYIKSL